MWQTLTLRTDASFAVSSRETLNRPGSHGTPINMITVLGDTCETSSFSHFGILSNDCLFVISYTSMAPLAPW